jgi:hypothetical protein
MDVENNWMEINLCLIEQTVLAKVVTPEIDFSAVRNCGKAAIGSTILPNHPTRNLTSRLSFSLSTPNIKLLHSIPYSPFSSHTPNNHYSRVKYHIRPVNHSPNFTSASKMTEHEQPNPTSEVPAVTPESAYNDLRRLIPSLAQELESLRTSLREHNVWIQRYGSNTAASDPLPSVTRPSNAPVDPELPA